MPGPSQKDYDDDVDNINALIEIRDQQHYEQECDEKLEHDRSSWGHDEDDPLNDD